MTDIQLLIAALPSVLSVIAVLVGILINNSRLGDTNSRISDLRSAFLNCALIWTTGLMMLGTPGGRSYGALKR